LTSWPSTSRRDPRRYPISPAQPANGPYRGTRDAGAGGYAIDALGMSIMLGIPVTITNTDPGT
jgi:hypothetical protein